MGRSTAEQNIAGVDRGNSGARKELARWVPTFESARHGVEFTGPAVAAAQLEFLLRQVASRPDVDDIAFVVVPHLFTSCSDLGKAMDVASAAGLSARVLFLVRHDALRSIDLASLRSGKAGLMLDLVDEDTPLSALMSDAIEAVRLDPALAERWSGQLRGALMIQMIRNLAHETGLASLGPSMQPDDGFFGLPIRFDYVAERTIADVLSRHRLK